MLFLLAGFVANDESKGDEAGCDDCQNEVEKDDGVGLHCHE